MNEKHEAIEARYEELARLLGSPDAAADLERLARLGREYSELEDRVKLIRRLRSVEREIRDAEELAAEPSDRELRELAHQELRDLRGREEKILEDLRRAFVPKDPDEDRDVILEVRAGTGGAEAALFAADLVRMYARYADRMGWKVESLSEAPTAMGGVKESILAVRGKGAFRRLRYESGVHRVQRVPVTEASGRIHTSAASVVVLPKAEEVDVRIEDDDIRVDVYRSSGHGGQSVNTTDSAVRVTHLPTGLVVAIQDEKSQHKNKAKALAILRSRLLDLERRKQEAERGSSRRSQIAGGDRSAKMRTYNFPQDRLTDHRISKTVYGLDGLLDGGIEELVQALIEADEAEQIAAARA